MNVLKMRSMWLHTGMILIVSSCASVPKPNSSDFAVHQTLVLAQKSDGIDGSLEILRDQRLTELDIKALQEHDPDTSPENSTRFKNNPLKPARLLLKSNDGQVLQSLHLEKPYATLEIAETGANKHAILVTQDFGIGMGSYNGPITKILDVTSDSMTWAKARQRHDGGAIPISLMRSLKSAWNFISTSEGKDILAVNSRPDEGSMEKFTTVFSRYHHDKSGWIVLTRSEGLLWEAEDGDHRLGYALPDQKKFPR